MLRVRHNATVTAMGLKRRAIGIASAFIAVTAFSAGCGFSMDAGHEFTDNRTETAVVNEIRLVGGDGAVTVERAGGTSVQIERNVWYRGNKPSGRTDRVDGATLRLDTRCGRNCAVSYTVKVPKAVDVKGHLDTGPISLTGVGAVAVDSNDGSIDIRDASGEVVARTDTGPIRLEKVAGSITARSSDGSIRISDAAQAVIAATDTGPIELAKLASTVEARTRDGSITMDGVAGSVTAQTDTGPISGTNLGGTHTAARTSDGSIMLKLSTAQDVEARTTTGPISLRVPPLDGGYRVEALSANGPTAVNVGRSESGSRSLTLVSQDGSITIEAT